jgi:hypothetical protein
MRVSQDVGPDANEKGKKPFASGRTASKTCSVLRVSPGMGKADLPARRFCKRAIAYPWPTHVDHGRTSQRSMGPSAAPTHPALPSIRPSGDQGGIGKSGGRVRRRLGQRQGPTPVLLRSGFPIPFRTTRPSSSFSSSALKRRTVCFPFAGTRPVADKVCPLETAAANSSVINDFPWLGSPSTPGRLWRCGFPL